MRRILMPAVVLLWALSAFISTPALADSPGAPGLLSQAGGPAEFVSLPNGRTVSPTPANLAEVVSHCARELQAGNGARYDLFGFHVALSADARLALIGAPGGYGQGGSVYLFVRHGSRWIQEQLITAAHGDSYGQFGFSVALSADGRVALVGAYGEDGDTGAVYVFELQGSKYVQKQELHASNREQGDYFGQFVAVSANGQVALIGANGKNSFRGVTYVFEVHGSSYAQVQQLQVTDGPEASGFGLVALSADGQVALIGASGNGNFPGLAYIFERRAPGFVQTQKLLALDRTSGDAFGNMTALSSDGKVALVGAPFGNHRQGAAYLFERQATGYVQVKKLQAADGAPGDLFGFLGGGLSADGHEALITAPYKKGQQGAAYLFQGSGSHYVQKKKVQAADGAPGDEFGFSAALSANGQTALVGAPYRKTAQGAAYVF